MTVVVGSRQARTNRGEESHQVQHIEDGERKGADCFEQRVRMRYSGRAMHQSLLDMSDRNKIGLPGTFSEVWLRI